MSTATTTGDHSRREALIRDLYAIVAFYVANPDHPLPRAVQLHHSVPAPADVEAVAERWAGGHTYGERMQCHHDLAQTSATVTFIVSVPGEDKPL